MASSRAITLPELLIALVVLFILFALLFPGPGGRSGLVAAKRAQAKNDVVQIATAVTAYETEYGRLPATKTEPVGGEVLAALRGEKSPLNPRQIVFLEVQNAKKGKSGITDGTFVDPWGGAYQIAYASGTNNHVTAGTNGIEVKKRAAVWNDPRLGRKDWNWNEQKQNKRYVTSWQ